MQKQKHNVGLPRVVSGQNQSEKKMVREKIISAGDAASGVSAGLCTHTGKLNRQAIEKQ